MYTQCIHTYTYTDITEAQQLRCVCIQVYVRTHKGVDRSVRIYTPLCTQWKTPQMFSYTYTYTHIPEAQ